MILKFTPTVEITVDQDSDLLLVRALGDIYTMLEINYEVWIDHNKDRLKGLTVVVPGQEFSFNHEINDEEYLVRVKMTQCDSEGVDENHQLQDVSPFNLELNISEITVDDSDRIVTAIATGVLFFD